MNGKIKPKPLKKGSRIGIVSPASPIESELLEKGLDHFRARGYEPVLFDHVLDRDSHLAGADMDRALDLMQAFNDTSLDAVVCSRGGYGCARLLRMIDLDQMAASRKMFIGFSDITTLHTALNKRGMVTFHTPMPLTLAYDREPWVRNSMFDLLEGRAYVPKEALTGETVTPGQAEGDLVGGCLCLICDTIGTPNQIETEGKVLVIEDVDEHPHRVDAMFTHLLNAGLLQKAAAVVVGEMTRTDEKVDAGIGGKSWTDIVAERLRQSGRPSWLGFSFGHAKNMASLALGCSVRVDTDARTLEYLESPCEVSATA